MAATLTPNTMNALERDVRRMELHSKLRTQRDRFRNQLDELKGTEQYDKVRERVRDLTKLVNLLKTRTSFG